MVLAAGIISAVIVSKKRPNYKTRLQKLQQKLKKAPLKQITLYQIPTKQIVTIAFIILFIFFFKHFEQSYTTEYFNYSSSQKENGSQDLSTMDMRYRRISFVLKWVKIVFGIMIMAVVSGLKWKIVKIQPNIIKVMEYSKQKFGQVRVIKLIQNNWRIQIGVSGKQKFSHNNSHFVIELINSSQKKRQQIIKRAYIFHARKTLIQISSILNFKPDLRIH